MGTNYFHRTNICEHCGRYNERHIGKSSAGWQFSFRGYRDEYHEGVPEIRSYSCWLALLENSGKIFNEYGEAMSLENFKSLVEMKRIEPGNHTLYCRVHHPEHAQRDCWIDGANNSFDSCEFS